MRSQCAPGSLLFPREPGNEAESLHALLPEEVGISSRDVRHGKPVQYFYGIWASAKNFFRKGQQFTCNLQQILQRIPFTIKWRFT